MALKRQTVKLLKFNSRTIGRPEHFIGTSGYYNIKTGKISVKSELMVTIT